MSEQVPGNENEKSPASSGKRSKSSVAQVSEVINLIDVSNSLAVPLKRAIDDILQLAAGSVGSAVASVLVRDGDEGGLKFLTATSGLSDALLALRLPPGAGIAGLVFSTHQPMAVADVSHEGSFWSEADRRTGFKTITVLATPLHANGQMVGVLEFINRPGDPPYPPFTPAEMDSGSRFADAIARLVDAYEISQLVESLFNYSIKASATTTSTANRENDLREWLEQSPASAEHRDLLMLWVSLREIVTRGGAEREFCRNLLEMIARFTAGRSGEGSNFGF
jgi:transcriptional regulator with GAF, ATPase, and Fis domain